MFFLPGLCFTFNSQTMSEIFKPSLIPDSWIELLNLNKKSTILNPLGYGPSNGLNFALNSFEPFNGQRSSKNFILSISNENNPFDIFKQKYTVEPGFMYTYRVVANQVYY